MTIVKDITTGALNLLVRFRTEWDNEWTTAEVWLAPSPDATHKLRIRFEGGTLQVQFKQKVNNEHDADWTPIQWVTPEKPGLEVEWAARDRRHQFRTHWHNGVVDSEIRQRLKGRGYEGWIAMKGIFVGKHGPEIKVATETFGIDYECQLRHCRNKDNREVYSQWSPIRTVRTKHEHPIGFDLTREE